MANMMCIMLLLGLACLHDHIYAIEYADKRSQELLRRIVQTYPSFLDVPYEDIIRFLAITRAELGLAGADPVDTIEIADEREDRTVPRIVQEESKLGISGDSEAEAAALLLTQAKVAAAALAQAEQDALAKAQKTEMSPTRGPAKFIGMPEGAGFQRGSCDRILNSTTGIRWIHGKSNMQTGAMTLVLFMSQQCAACHDVAIKINSIYKQWRHRGLNVLALHASPKGFSSSEDDIEQLKAFIEREGIEFAIADLASKDGTQPVLKASGLPDWKRAAAVPTTKSSLYRYLFDDLEYAVPVSIIYKNCVPLMAEPLDGYFIMGLDRSIAASQELMLWPFGHISDDDVQLAGFKDAAMSHGLTPEELEWEWEGSGVEDSGEDIEPDHNAASGKSVHAPVRRRGRKRRGTAPSATASAREGEQDEAAKRNDGIGKKRFDPRDDRSGIIDGDGADNTDKEELRRDSTVQSHADHLHDQSRESEQRLDLELEGLSALVEDVVDHPHRSSGASRRKSRLLSKSQELRNEELEETQQRGRAAGSKGKGASTPSGNSETHGWDSEDRFRRRGRRGR